LTFNYIYSQSPEKITNLERIILGLQQNQKKSITVTIVSQTRRKRGAKNLLSKNKLYRSFKTRKISGIQNTFSGFCQIAFDRI